MLSPVVIVVAVLLVCAAMTVSFYVENKRIAERSNTIVLARRNKIERHRAQIAERELGLNRYDLLKYNLDDALIIQKEINLRMIFEHD